MHPFFRKSSLIFSLALLLGWGAGEAKAQDYQVDSPPYAPKLLQCPGVRHH